MSYAFPRAGDLTERVIIERRDKGGKDFTVWHSCMAELMPMRGDEFVAAQGVKPQVKVRFRMRYSKGVATLDTRDARIICKGAVYNITYIEDDKNKHVQLYVACERVT